MCVCFQHSPRISPLYAEQELDQASPSPLSMAEKTDDWRRAVLEAQSWWVSCRPAGSRAHQMGRIPHTAPPRPKLSEGREPSGPLQGLQWAFLMFPFQSVQIGSDRGPQGAPEVPLSDLPPAQALASCWLGQGPQHPGPTRDHDFLREACPPWREQRKSLLAALWSHREWCLPAPPSTP